MILSLDRTLDGDLWATSSRRLLRSEDDGVTWAAVVKWSLGGAIGVPFPDSSGAYLQSGETFAIWDAATNEVSRAQNHSRRGIRPQYRRGELWLSYGYDETGAAANRRHTTSGPSLSVPGVFGWTACSMDQGRSWTVIDSYEGAAVVAMHLESDNTLTLLMSDFGLRRGRLELTGPGAPQADMQTLVEPRSLVPASSWLRQWVLMDGDRGRISANRHHGGTGVLFETVDGGSHWQLIRDEVLPVTEILRLGDGRWLKLERRKRQAGFTPRMLEWKDGGFEEFPLPPTNEVLDIKEATIAASGDLLLLLRSGELWVYETESNVWRCLWEEPAGGASIDR